MEREQTSAEALENYAVRLLGHAMTNATDDLSDRIACALAMLRGDEYVDDLWLQHEAQADGWTHDERRDLCEVLGLTQLRQVGAQLHDFVRPASN